MNKLYPAEILIPSKIICKRNGLSELPAELKEFGPHGVVVHGASFEKKHLKAKLRTDLSRAGLRTEFFCRGQGADRTEASGFCRSRTESMGFGADRTGSSGPCRSRTCALSASEATLDEVSAVIEKGRAIEANWIVGIGGGSALDLAKAAAGLFNASEKPAYYQEGGLLNEKGIPFIAAPTTAGSGSEATPNAVIINAEKKLKLSIRDKKFLASRVILDPELLKGAPKPVMAFSGMDALVQAYESFISKNASEFSETLALRAVELISRHLVLAVEKQGDIDLHAMLVGSFLAGIAFSHSRLGVIHGIAHPLGVLYGVPHGLVCSVCFIPSIKINRETMGEKYDRLGRAAGTDFSEKILCLEKTLGISSPFKGKPLIEKEKIIRETLKSGSTVANPKPITREDAEFILQEIF